MMHIRNRLLTIGGLALLCPLLLLAQTTGEVILSAENAYNPIPSPNGSLIAYVRTGWSTEFFGSGRASLRSEVAVMTPSGDVLSHASPSRITMCSERCT